MADEEKKEPKQKPKSDEAPRRPSTRKASAEKTPAAATGEAKPRSGGARASTAKPKPATTRRRAPARAKKEAEEPKAAARSEAPADEAPEVEAPVAEEKPAAAKPKPRRRAAAPKKSARPAPPRPVVKAQAKYVRSSARKARLVLEHMRGKSIADARAVLRYSPRGVARDLERLLDSAVANAENNHDLVGDDLFVKEVYADEGPTLKRFRPRAQGRAYRVRKRTSHLTMTLTPKE
jgi:ribosomal protein L22